MTSNSNKNRLDGPLMTFPNIHGLKVDDGQGWTSFDSDANKKLSTSKQIAHAWRFFYTMTFTSVVFYTILCYESSTATSLLFSLSKSVRE